MWISSLVRGAWVRHYGGLSISQEKVTNERTSSVLLLSTIEKSEVSSAERKKRPIPVLIPNSRSLSPTISLIRCSDGSDPGQGRDVLVQQKGQQRDQFRRRKHQCMFSSSSLLSFFPPIRFPSSSRTSNFNKKFPLNFHYQNSWSSPFWERKISLKMVKKDLNGSLLIERHWSGFWGEFYITRSEMDALILRLDGCRCSSFEKLKVLF